jgi:hypothetical protein
MAFATASQHAPVSTETKRQARGYSRKAASQKLPQSILLALWPFVLLSFSGHTPL